MAENTFGQGTPNDNAFPDPAELAYEQARDELIETVKILELGQMSLDESLKYWERGEALAKRCEVLLDGAQQRVESALGTAGTSDTASTSDTAGTSDIPADTSTGTPTSAASDDGSFAGDQE